ncbi:MAG TPA: hypothetical protein VJG64_02055 [Candidatus Paceibacterota bacterium]
MKKSKETWTYKNTSLLIVSLAVLFFVADTDVAHSLIRAIGSYGYWGASIAGVFSVSTFTVAPALVILFHLAQEFNPVLVALCAGIGATISDLLIFRFLKDGVFEELKPLYREYGGSHISTLFRTRHFAWLAPVVGALIIASPLPDEIGVALMGLSRIKTWQFVGLSFALNAVGILAVVLLARSI